ncbi:MAG: NgoPII family restriction endonuclease [Oscillospiraceae bacterium]|nr:NgoPII family restriction endonuclease [Oscillospiraceae bacterium]
MINILNAIKTLADNPVLEVGEFYLGRNRINNIGDGLQEYVKDLFANSINDENATRAVKISEVFSYNGNSNNPPDLMLKGGDAIEIKKIESMGSELALNSSYPKAKLYANSPMLTNACRNCENWHEKDMLYIIGVMPRENGEEGTFLTTLFFIYGIDFAASTEFYENILSDMTDPLGITSIFRRGKCKINNFSYIFNYVYTPSLNTKFEFVAIINKDKYDSFPATDKKALENLSEIKIEDVKIKNPDNPLILKQAKLIKYNKGA